jgi:hypothetical protein
MREASALRRSAVVKSIAPTKYLASSAEFQIALLSGWRLVPIRLREVFVAFIVSEMSVLGGFPK